MTRSIRLGMVAVAAAIVSAAAVAQRVVHDLTGRWAFAVVTENGTGTPAVTFKQEGETLTGTYVSGRMGERQIAGTVRKDTVSFVLKGGEVELRFIGRIVNADSLSGTLDMGGMGEATFTAKREKPPAR